MSGEARKITKYKAPPPPKKMHLLFFQKKGQTKAFESPLGAEVFNLRNQ